MAWWSDPKAARGEREDVGESTVRLEGPVEEPPAEDPGEPLELEDPTPSRVLGIPSELIDAVRQSGRVAIVAGHSSHAFLSKATRHLLESIRAAGYPAVYVEAGDHGDALLDAACHAADLVVARESRGRDVGSWIDALGAVPEIASLADSILLTNDSVIGPLHSLDAVFEKMSRRRADFWGITDSWCDRYHLQSYWLHLSGALLRDEAFTRFAEAEGGLRHGDGHVEDGAVDFSAALIAAGATPAALCPYEEVAARWLESNEHRLGARGGIPFPISAPTVDYEGGETGGGPGYYDALAANIRLGEPMDPTHPFWEILIRDFGSPFVKRSLVCRNPMGVPDLAALPSVLASTPIDVRDAIDEAMRLHARGRAPSVARHPRPDTGREATPGKTGAPGKVVSPIFGARRDEP